MSPKKWIEATDAIGIVSKAGRYGGTYAHSDIAMSFATWISPEFQLYIVKDYRRLKTDENSRLSLNWNLNREISKLNYRIHTDAIKDNLIPPELTPAQIAYTYANEADMLNVVLFGKTAKQWKDENPAEKGNMRDAATLNQLLVLANLESYNAVLINQGNPYTQEQFRTDAVSIDENLMVIKLLFPEPEKAPLCYYSFLFFDKSSEKINFFCIEKSSIEADPLPHLCGRSADGSHLNYGRGTFEEEDNFLKCVEIYRKQGG